MGKSSNAAATVLVLALFMGAAVPAGAIEKPAPKLDVTASLVAPLEINPVRITFGRYVYIKFNKWEVRTIAYRLGSYYKGVLAAANVFCTYFPTFVGKALCVAAITYLGNDIYYTFKAAARAGQCAQILVGYNAWLLGRFRPYDVVRYSC